MLGRDALDVPQPVDYTVAPPLAKVAELADALA